MAMWVFSSCGKAALGEPARVGTPQHHFTSLHIPLHPSLEASENLGHSAKQNVGEKAPQCPVPPTTASFQIGFDPSLEIKHAAGLVSAGLVDGE